MILEDFQTQEFEFSLPEIEGDPKKCEEPEMFAEKRVAKQEYGRQKQYEIS